MTEKEVKKLCIEAVTSRATKQKPTIKQVSYPCQCLKAISLLCSKSVCNNILPFKSLPSASLFLFLSALSDFYADKVSEGYEERKSCHEEPFTRSCFC